MATRWYQRALRSDPYCYEALEELTKDHLLSGDEELFMVDQLGRALCLPCLCGCRVARP